MSRKIEDGMTPQQRYYKKNKERIKRERREKFIKQSVYKHHLMAEGIFYDPNRRVWGNSLKFIEDSFATKLKYGMSLKEHGHTPLEDACIIRLLLNGCFWYLNVGIFQRDRHFEIDGARFNNIWPGKDIEIWLAHNGYEVGVKHIASVANVIGLYSGGAKFKDMGNKQLRIYRPDRDGLLVPGMKETHPMPFFNKEYKAQHGLAKEEEIYARALEHINAVRSVMGLPTITKDIMAEAYEKTLKTQGDRVGFLIEAGKYGTTEERQKAVENEMRWHKEAEEEMKQIKEKDIRKALDGI